jgi:hypothetical protein
MKLLLKFPKLWGLESYQTGEYNHVPTEWYIPTPQGQKLPQSGPFWTFSYRSTYLAVEQAM